MIPLIAGVLPSEIVAIVDAIEYETTHRSGYALIFVRACCTPVLVNGHAIVFRKEWRTWLNSQDQATQDWVTK